MDQDFRRSFELHPVPEALESDIREMLDRIRRLGGEPTKVVCHAETAEVLPDKIGGGAVVSEDDVPWGRVYIIRSDEEEER